MALPRILAVALMLSLLLLRTAVADESFAGLSPMAAPAPAPAGSIDCGAECGRRCSKSSRPNRCNRACMSCCHTCKCVPPGTAGNVEVCPCYASIINPRNGAPKCP